MGTKMNSLAGIKIISLDLFRTLIAVDDSYQFVWHQFLGKDYTEEKALQHWNRASEILNDVFTRAALADEFKNVRVLFGETYRTLFSEIHLDYDPQVAAGILIEGHKRRKLFDDVIPFFTRVKGKYNICLSTDADREILEDIRQIHEFDRVFVSEEIGAYKLNPKFFTEVLAQYKVPPEIILHIGDSHTDVMQPKQLGIKTCWINRYNQDWRYDIKPDFEVKSLLEIAELLG
jgi:putative hydrolase of the HAD superfamily